MGISGCGPVISFVEAELAVGRWRATDCVVLLARAATHRKASGSPSFTVCALTACVVPPQDTFLGCPFTGTLSRHHFHVITLLGSRLLSQTHHYDGRGSVAWSVKHSNQLELKLWYLIARVSLSSRVYPPTPVCNASVINISKVGAKFRLLRTSVCTFRN